MELGTDPRRRSSGREEDEEELLRRRQLQEEQLMKVCPRGRPQVYFLLTPGIWLLYITTVSRARSPVGETWQAAGGIQGGKGEARVLEGHRIQGARLWGRYVGRPVWLKGCGGVLQVRIVCTQGHASLARGISLG